MGGRVEIGRGGRIRREVEVQEVKVWRNRYGEGNINVGYGIEGELKERRV